MRHRQLEARKVFHLTQNTSMFASRVFVSTFLHSINSCSLATWSTCVHVDIYDRRRGKIGIPDAVFPSGKPLRAAPIHSSHKFSIELWHRTHLPHDFGIS